MTWPKEDSSKVYRTSDGDIFLDRKEAEDRERVLGLAALCDDVFGKDGSGHYGSLNSDDVYKGLIQHRELFLKFLVAQ